MTSSVTFPMYQIFSTRYAIYEIGKYWVFNKKKYKLEQNNLPTDSSDFANPVRCRTKEERRDVFGLHDHIKFYFSYSKNLLDWFFRFWWFSMPIFIHKFKCRIPNLKLWMLLGRICNSLTQIGINRWNWRNLI